MHVVVGLLVVALLVYLIHRAMSARSSGGDAPSSERSDLPFAFLSNGLVFARARGGRVEQVHSTYAQEAADRRERARSRHSWKEGTTFNVAAGGGRRGFESVDKPLVATAAAYTPDGSLLYFLKDDHIGGLFRRDAGSERELRVVLKQGLHLTDLNPSADGAALAASSHQSDGIANIALMNADGSGYRELTGGDTVDSSPAWIPGAERRMLFQSAGLARNGEGHILALGNASIQMLDLDSGTVTPVVDDAAFDHLKPRVAPSGDLLYIRRPHEAPRYGPGAMLADTLFFPFRLLRALFHYLNFFSLMYSRKPLTSADASGAQADMKDILLQGRRIDLEKALRSTRPVQGVPSLVPESWLLVARNRDGQERVLATNVASYDVSPDGTVVYTNGRGVFVLDVDGTSRIAVTDQLVGDVVAPAMPDRTGAVSVS